MFPSAAPTSSVKLVSKGSTSPVVKPKAAPKKVLSKSTASKKAASGKDMGKKNVSGKTGFNTVKNKALKEYGSVKAANKVAGSVFQNMRSSGKL